MTNLKTIQASEWTKLICSQEECNVLDVRTLPEYREVHLQKDAVHVPLDQIDPSRIRSMFSDTTKPIYVLCKGGKRAAAAAEKLNDAGITNILVVDGGLDACMACGVPVVRGNVILLERQVRMAAGALVVTGIALGVMVHPAYLALSAGVGIGLFSSGLTGWCGLALLLAKAPWNK
jgi:rhodanese-related sulfurtransferase